jgi:CheY-like chemotaxis protein
MSKKINKNVSVIHELLSPLNIILGLTQILTQDNTLSSKHKEMIESIQNAGENLLSHIREIFDKPDNDTEICLADTAISCINNIAPIHVLIVDDIAINRFLIKKMLSQYPNIITCEAADAKSAINHIEKTKPHIVLTDIYMPDMNGFDLIQYIRKNPSNNDIIFIVMSSEAKSYYEDQIAACNVDAYLSKPIRMNSLIALFEQIVPKLNADNNETELPFISLPEKLPDENFLQELIRLASQGAYSEIKNMMEQLKTRQSEFMAFIRNLEQLLKKFQFKEMIDWINFSRSKKDQS